MRQVFDRPMVAHLWANRSQDSARVSGGNFWFTGPTLYSYGSHFVCGHHMPAAYARNGASLVLLNDDNYSMTTSRHMGAARDAARHLERVYVPGLNEDKVRFIERHGAREVVAALIGRMRTQADKAANPRIKADTRAALLRDLATLRADALHIAGVDAARRDLSADVRKKARAQLSELATAVPEDGGDKAAARLYAFALNRGMYAEKMRERLAAAARFIRDAHYNVECLNPETAESYASRADEAMGEAKQFADKAETKIPRAAMRDYRAIAPGSKWRTEVQAKARAAAVEWARNEWAETEARMRAALDECDMNTLARGMYGDGRRAFETLHGEPGDEERRAFVAMTERVYSEWRAKSEEQQGRELLAKARELIEAGKFTAACDTARSAAHKLRRSYQPREGDESENLITSAEDVAALAVARMPEEYAAQLQAWRDAVPGARFPAAMERSDRGAYLRLSADRKRVETSQGAEVPARVCAVMWRLIGEAKGQPAGKRFSPGDVQLGHFSLDSIDANGNVRAGCHFIPYSELADIAARLSYAPHN